MCGPKTDGVSRQSSPLAMFQTEGEDNGGEEKSEADMSEERNAEEGGKVNIYVRDKDKNNCTTHETSLVGFISVVFADVCIVCLPTNK